MERNSSAKRVAFIADVILLTSRGDSKVWDLEGILLLISFEYQNWVSKHAVRYFVSNHVVATASG